MTTKTKKVNIGYAAYQFRNGEQDPIVDQLRTIFEDHSGSVEKTAELSGISPGTIRNWWSGKTKRPQFCTAAACARSMGYDFVLAPRHTNATATASVRVMKRFPTQAELQRVKTNGNGHVDA